MLNWIINWSLRRRLLVLGATLGFIVWGLIAVSHLNIDAFPDTTPVQVQINTVAPALGPEEVERQITIPVEQSISGLPSLTNVRSISKFGLSQVVVTFGDDVDIYFARRLIGERLATVGLPAGIATPEMGPVATGLGEIFHYVVHSDSRSLTELRTIQDWTIKPVLRAVPGVAEINRTAERLAGLADASVLPLHGSLEPADKRRALGPDPQGRRKIIHARPQRTPAAAPSK